MKKKLYISQIDDIYVQNNFKTLSEIFRGNPYLKGDWAFLTFSIKSSGPFKVPHTLPFKPLDTILLSAIGGSVTFNYTEFDSTYISGTATVTSSPMTIRMFIGTYSEDTVNV